MAVWQQHNACAGSCYLQTIAYSLFVRLKDYDNSGFDRGAGRLQESLWLLCKALFFQNPLPWPSALRVALLRLFGAQVGSGVVIRSGVNITFPWRFRAGDAVWIGEEVQILSLAPVELGSNVCLSQRSFLCTGSHNFHKDTFDLVVKPVVIEDEVWVAAQAFVGPGVVLRSKSVVSAGSVVLESAPPGSFLRGNPAVPVLQTS